MTLCLVLGHVLDLSVWIISLLSLNSQISFALQSSESCGYRSCFSKFFLQINLQSIRLETALHRQLIYEFVASIFFSKVLFFMVLSCKKIPFSCLSNASISVKLNNFKSIHFLGYLQRERQVSTNKLKILCQETKQGPGSYLN